MENTSIQFFLKSSFFDRPREFSINKDFLEFDDKDDVYKKPTKFLRQDVEAFRFGVRWNRGYFFIFGRTYCIDIKSKNGEIIKLRLQSIYGIRKKRLGKKYSKILNAVFSQVLNEMTKSYMQLFSVGADFQIENAIFDRNGIRFKGKRKDETIQWKDVGTSAYASYYAIFSKSNPQNYKAFNYLSDWNSAVIHTVSRQILMEKGFYAEK